MGLYFGFPYTAADEEKINMPTPYFIHDLMRLRLPITLFSAYFNGLSIDSVADLDADKWITASKLSFLNKLCKSDKLVVEPRKNFALSLMFFLFPVDIAYETASKENYGTNLVR